MMEALAFKLKLATHTKNCLTTIVKSTSLLFESDAIDDFTVGMSRATSAYCIAWQDLLKFVHSVTPPIPPNAGVIEALLTASAMISQWQDCFAQHLCQYGVDIRSINAMPATKTTATDAGAEAFLMPLIDSIVMRAFGANYAESPLPFTTLEGQADWEAYSGKILETKILSFFVPGRAEAITLAIGKIMSTPHHLFQYLTLLQQLLANGETLCEYAICKFIIKPSTYEKLTELVEEGGQTLPHDLAVLLDCWKRSRRIPNQFRLCALLLGAMNPEKLERFVETHRPLEEMSPAALGRFLPLVMKIFNQGVPTNLF